MIEVQHYDCWRAVLYWCQNVELARLWLTGDSVVQQLLNTTVGLQGKGEYYPVLAKFAKLTQLDLMDDALFKAQSIPSLPMPILLNSLKIKVRTSIDFSSILPGTITDLTIVLVASNTYISGISLNLAKLPCKITSIKIKQPMSMVTQALVWTTKSEAIWRSVSYPELLTINISGLSTNNSAIASLIGSSPSLTNLTLNYCGYEYNSGPGIIVPFFPHLERLRKLTLKLLPYHQSSFDYLALFKDVQLKVSFMMKRNNDSDVMPMQRDLIAALSARVMLLKVWDAPQMYNRFRDLKSLTVVTSPDNDTCDIDLPNLRKLVLVGYVLKMLRIPSTVKVVDFQRLNIGSSANDPTIITHPDFRPQVIQNLPSSGLLKLTSEQLSQLRKLTAVFSHDLLEDNFNQLKSLSNINSLNVAIKDKDINGVPSINVLLSLCGALPMLTELAIFLDVNSSSTHYLKELIFPNNITDISVSMKETVSVKCVSFPPSLVNLHTDNLGMSIEQLLTLKECRNIKIVHCMINKHGFSLLELQAMLDILPLRLESMVLRKHISQMVTQQRNVPRDLSRRIQDRSRFLFYLEWDGEIYVR